MVHLNPGIRFIKSTNDLMTLMYLFWSTLGGAKKNRARSRDYRQGGIRKIELYWFIWKTVFYSDVPSIQRRRNTERESSCSAHPWQSQVISPVSYPLDHTLQS